MYVSQIDAHFLKKKKSIFVNAFSDRVLIYMLTVSSLHYLCSLAVTNLKKIFFNPVFEILLKYLVRNVDGHLM